MRPCCPHNSRPLNDPAVHGGGLGEPPERSLLSRLLASLAVFIDRYVIGWHRLPTLLGLPVLLGIRTRLRQQNLVDTRSLVPSHSAAPHGIRVPPGCGRTADGADTDLGDPAMGRAGTPFGRNVPLGHAHVDHQRLLVPNPRTISNKLLARRTFQAVPQLNLLAAAWLQFMVHDWFSHGPNPQEQPIEVPIEDPDDTWPQGSMMVQRTLPGPAQPSGQPPVFLNTETHWWDASQLYGSTPARQDEVREGAVHGKLRLVDGLLPLDRDGLELTGFNDNWWIGLSLLHTLFAREHNAICDHLRARYPNWCDDALFAHARLINAALLAKIHTIEWTPAILGHRTVRVGMKGNWWGLASEAVHRLLGRLSDSEVLSGIPGSPTDHHGVPYTITEEFVAVYRMHPLMPDNFAFFSAREPGHLLSELDLYAVSGQSTRTVLDKVKLADVAYSFGLMHPGAITLHNYPNTLRRLPKGGQLLDLAAIDILRDRERGVPRYNEFRQLLHRPRIRTFDELTRTPGWADDLREVYNAEDPKGPDRVDDLDLMVGLLAETPPGGFGFSDTAFRIFILMASRRLKSDRYFTTDYTPEVYTPEGIAWIEDNNMRSVLLRHLGGQGFTELEAKLGGVKNAFLPWA